MSNSTVPATSLTTPSGQSTSVSTSSHTTPITSSTTPITSSSTSISTSIHSTSTSSVSVPRTTVFSTSTFTQPNTRSTTTLFSTSTSTPTSLVTQASSTTSSASTTSTSPAALQDGTNNSGNGSGGLSTAGKTAVAVVVPVVVVALLVIAGIFLWRKRKQKKEAEELRRKEIQDYGYNPNNDPTLPSVMQETRSEMAEDSSGYRGWGAAAVGSNRKTSTTLSGGLTHAQFSDSGSNVYGAASPGSPGNRASDGNSGDGLMNRRETMGSDDLGALGVAPVTSNPQIRRGPSNASSAYSGGARSDHSDEQPPMPGNPGYAYDYNSGNQYGYSQHGPYGDGSYGGAQDSGMPVVRDVSARRNTRIQQGGTYQQGNSGIAQNF